MNDKRLYLPNAETYEIAAQLLHSGNIISFPTETVYGLGADARNSDAVAKIYAAKDRPSFNPLIVHVEDKNIALKYVKMNDLAIKLAEAFWPGPFTMVLPLIKENNLSELITAGLETVAIRVPENKIARDLLNRFKGPIAAPSANISGKISPTTAVHVAGEFGDELEMIIDGGPCKNGIESTIVQVKDDQIILLRPGNVTVQDIEVATNQAVVMADAKGGRIASPGQLERHYAPSTSMRLNAGHVKDNECLLAFGKTNLVDGVYSLNLSPNGDLSEAAANLFSMMRELDERRFSTIAVSPIPTTGLGLAINDRLKRAAAPRKKYKMGIDPTHLEALKSIVDEKGWTEDQDIIAPHVIEPRGKFSGKTPLLLFPDSTSTLSSIVSYANANNLKIVPQGGNTGLVGGSIPDGTDTEILVNLKRMNAVREVDPLNHAITVEAGMILSDVHQAADKINCQFPMHLASEGSAMIGGNISTNAGGINVLHYGVMRDLVLGLEVVLPSGEIWQGLNGLRKNNTGYDLKQLFIGAEGTLGIITAATLKLYPVAKQKNVAFVAISNPEAAIKLLDLAQEVSGDNLIAFEILPRIGLDFTIKHMPDCRDPLSDEYSWYILMECATSLENDLLDLEKVMEKILEKAMEHNLVVDGVIPKNVAEMKALWNLREFMSEAQKFEGGSIKHDISVAVSKIPEFLSRATQAVQNALPDVRPVPFGHIGDGNIHFNLSQPVGMDKNDYLSKWEEINRVVHDIVADLDGSISAEHGIGILKVEELERYKPAIDLKVMRDVKKVLDPNNIMNPGRIIR